MFQKKQKQSGRSSPQKQTDKSTNFSYYSSRTLKNDLRRTKPKTDDVILALSKKSKNTIGRIPAILLFLLIVTSLCYLLYLNNNVNIKAISTNHKNFIVNTDTYKQAAMRYLSNSIANNTKVTINNTGLSEYMLLRFPELSSAISGSPFFGHSPTLTITEAKPSSIITDKNKNFFLLKNNGVAMTVVSSADSKNFTNSMPFIINSFSKININKQALSNSDLAFILYVYDELEAQSIKTLNYTLVPNSRELDVKPAAQLYTIKFNLEEDAKVQTGSYLALRGYLQTNKITVPQYIDVRVLGRAYYK